MNDRYHSIGIKQVIHLEWMQKTTDLLLAGLHGADVRHELDRYLLLERGKSEQNQGSQATREFAIGNLLKTWSTPDKDLVPLRDGMLEHLRSDSQFALALHWGMISAAYPFWGNVARQTGRLLALQDEVTQVQIVTRLKEQYGDRQTITRYSQYVIRAFIEWGVLKDIDGSGRYARSTPLQLDHKTAILLLEALLWTSSEKKSALGPLVNSPALFPFSLPTMSGDFIARHDKRVTCMRYGVDEEYLQIEEPK